MAVSQFFHSSELSQLDNCRFCKFTYKHSLDSVVTTGSMVALLITIRHKEKYCRAWLMNKTDEIILVSTITCPECGHSEKETMLMDACQFYYDCKGCGALLRPNQGDCCVFCSFATVPCPPIQEARLQGKRASCCRCDHSSEI